MGKPTLTEKLSEIRRQEEELRTKDLAEKLNLPYLNLFALPIDPEGLKLIAEETARKANLIVLQKQDKKLQIALVDPKNTETQKVLEDLKKQGFNYSLFLVSSSGLKKALAHYQEITLIGEEITGQIGISPQLISQLQKEIKNLDDLRKKINQLTGVQISKLLEIMIAGALNLDASDIHLEPKEKNTHLKYRLDGLLHQVVFLSNKTYSLALPRIKLLSGMKLNIRDVAQDGRFTIRLEKIDIEVRASVIPGAYGENIVLRILNPKTISLDLKDLGFRQEDLEIIEQQTKKPNGLIISTGPTGSGKTTTLYAFLKKTAKPEIKIITLEDPIEYHLEGITQTQVESEVGYTFAAGLRAILRQDPDVILVGEIRDKETAEIAINASLTGHLVFSTLHTNDAAGAIPRFIDLGIKPGVLAASLSLIMAQRLARRLCQKCKKEYKPTKEILEKIKKALEGVDDKVIEGGRFYQAKGCDQCNKTGYKGRVAILEMIVIDQDLEKLVALSPSHAQVREFSHKKGLLTMYQDGLLKVLSGITTLEELERVVG